MNRFITSDVVDECATDLCDKHLRKMIIEEAQMLSTAIHNIAPNVHAAISDLYKPTHAKHPCTVWAGLSSENYRYAYTLFSAMCDEYQRRFRKTHLTDHKLRVVFRYIVNTTAFEDMFEHQDLTDHPQCMPDEYKTHESWPVTAYRTYMRDHKAHVMSMQWTNTPVPHWFH